MLRLARRMATAPSAAATGSVVQAAQVDHRDLLDAEAGEVGLDAGPELLGALSRAQRDAAAGVRVGAHLADHQDAVLRPERVPDEAVDEAVAVELGSVDMVDAEFDRATQQSECGGTVVMETFELHRA